MISVVIVNYYSARQTERAIKSVLQSGVEREIIVVDNTCTTGEREVLDEMRRSYGFSLVCNDKNLGFARACNQAYARSKGKYIFLLNPDAFVVPSCLGILREFLENTPPAGSASPQVYWDDEMRYFFPHYTLPSPSMDLCVRLSSLSKTFRTIYSLSERRRNLELWKSSTPVRVKNLHGGVVMVRRSAAEQSGGLFDERFFLFYEDTDLFFRLRKRGYSLYTIPEAKAVHNYSHSEKKLEMMSRTTRLYFEKHFSRNLLLRISSFLPEGSLEGPYHDYGIWNDPPLFPVPKAFRDGYLFEWSPSPLFIPSIGCFGKGGEFAFSRQVWDLLDDGRYFNRFSPPSKRIGKYTTGYLEKRV
ncbi:MAG TPA: glycosyltransferase family 2 protein [Thermodesulfovibrionales bacterium]|nr:glycosyltransferase family 2 protein [Thermodesulfovibrionales bacterium]